MPRRPRDAKLETREGRKKLKPRREPYWRQIHRGLFIGYYRGTQAGSWRVRRQTGASKVHQRIGTADDYADADGKTVLSYAQAVEKAMGGSIDAIRSSVARDGYTVAECVSDYLDDYRARGKSFRTTELQFSRHVLPKFGKKPVSSITSAELQKWLNNLAKGRAKSTANRVWNSFRAALNYALFA